MNGLLFALIIVMGKGFFHASFANAQCSQSFAKLSPLHLLTSDGDVTVTSPASNKQKCLWILPPLERSQAVIFHVKRADMRVPNTKRCAGQIIFPGSQARQCVASKTCRVFTHENSSCSILDMTSQKFRQCVRLVVTHDNAKEMELKYVLSTKVTKRIMFTTGYKIINCSKQATVQSETEIVSTPATRKYNASTGFFLKTNYTEKSEPADTTIAYSTESTDRLRDSPEAEISLHNRTTASTYAMTAIIVLLFLCLAAACAKLILIRLRNKDSPFHNPTVVAYVHQEQRDGNNPGDPRSDIRNAPSHDSIPSNTALYAEIGSGAWNANQEIHDYIELPQPASVEASRTGPSRVEIGAVSQNRNSRTFPESLYSKVNRIKKKRANAND